MFGLQATGNDGEAALKETGSINRSLFTLGQVLAGLSMRKPSFRYFTVFYVTLVYLAIISVMKTAYTPFKRPGQWCTQLNRLS